MPKSLRCTLALVMMVVSLVLLAWASWPGERIVRHRLIQPTEMQLPTPESSSSLQRVMAGASQFETARSIRTANHFILILDGERKSSG